MLHSDIKLLKSSGEIVTYDSNKIRETLQRASTRPETIESVVTALETHLVDGMTTREIFRILKHELKRADRHAAQRYNLRGGLLRLGPAGFKFEKYVAAVLGAYQYDAEVPPDEFSGLCVDHEVDIVAKKDGHIIMIEAKFRNRFDDVVTLKDIMATWARFVDLMDGGKAGKAPRFDEAWVVTNGRFSDRAHMFGVCKGMHLIGWSTKERSLARMVDHAALYPITVLDYLRNYEVERFSRHDLMLCSEIAEADPNRLAAELGLEPIRVRRIVTDCRELIDGKRHTGHLLTE
jgi:hypothetical protein